MAFNFSRYAIRKMRMNADASYYEQFRTRGVNFISQYTTPHSSYPTVEQISSLTIQKEIWASGMRFYKLADKYYNDSELWWLIPWFNKRPLETDFKMGSVVLIPTPLNTVLALYTSLNG